MITAIAFAVVFSWWQAAATSGQPRVSATDTSYLSCTTWTGNGWTDPTARSSRTPVTESPKGFRAYAEVKVAVKDGSCENTTTLYVASGAGRSFRIAYAKTPSASDGNGIRLIGWSPSGDKLLAEVNLWKYETDTGFGHVALIYDASTEVAKEIHPEQALSRHFGPNCEFELAVEGWRANEQMLIRVSRTTEEESYEQHFCVKEPRLFVFDLRKETVQTDPRESQKAN